jgi:hypothetical protein
LLVQAALPHALHCIIMDWDPQRRVFVWFGLSDWDPQRDGCQYRRRIGLALALQISSAQ